ncbi:hypothetical protein A3F06_02370 [candidate division TM6 bacterium RIFCSPHIGHO2_12_FULL_36_22]|nr:MAG: hypothetical protein A3F06_02370 [candidate division TM6 bacterium RIFCSPHIGHO2_12_FULL_36_22]
MINFLPMDVAMKWYRGSAVLIALLICSMGMYSFRKIEAQSCYMPAFRLSLDSTFSPQLQQELTKYIESQKNLCPQQIKELFPAVAAVTMEQLPPNIKRVHIDSQTPLCKINLETVLDKNGHILIPAYFRSDILNDLPSIATKRPDHNIFMPISSELIQFLISLPPEMLQQFSIMWLDKTKIYFIDKATQNWGFILQYQQQPSDYITDLCHRLLREQITENLKTNNTYTIIDLRFKGQAIICKKRGNLLNES